MDKKMGLSSSRRPAQGFVAPGEPLHRVVGVLAEVRARLVGQVVHQRDARARGCGPDARRSRCEVRARLVAWSLN